MNEDIVHVKKSPRFSNTSDQVGGSSIRKQIWVPKSRGQEKGLATGARVGVQKASVQKNVIEPRGHARVQQLENLHHVSMKREASSAELVTSQNLLKSSGGNGNQPRHSQSVENVKKRGMAWIPKGSVQVHNETDVKVEVGCNSPRFITRYLEVLLLSFTFHIYYIAI
uniref:Uncharacterized protein n=1 Tax=Oryza barthii TaxID=65489 RepID=A0A0D3G5I2_9ORYZ